MPYEQLAGRFDEFLTTMREQTQAVGRLTESHAPIEAREIPIEKAMEEVLRLFKEKKRLYYSDIAETLRLDVGTVVTACELLQKKGLIEGDPSGKEKAKRPRRH